MHSGSSLSPKHPAIPVSIGIASLVLEGRSSALDDSSIYASATACATSSVLVSGHGNGGGGGGASGGSGIGSGAAGGGGGDDEEDGGFCGQRRASESAGGASSLQQCSLMAINESQKTLAMSCCHTPNETQRINLKLQQIRSSCPSTSKDEIQQLVTVSGEPSRLPSGGGGHRHERKLYESFSSVVPQHDPAARGSSSSPSSTVTSWFSHELPISASNATAGVVIYSGFEKMNVLGTVSPIKNHPMGKSFINFSSSSVSAAPSSSSVSSVQPTRKPVASPKLQSSSLSSASVPREGPHCGQFLKKIGLNKPDTAEGSEHHCSYRNKYCLRWQVYFKQLSTILTNGEAVCIEVYLGPENHTILLEQWILKLVMTKSPATMTMQSLCAAIRSQLYFSQISAWTDLIKKSLEPDIFSHPRIKKIIPAAASGGASFSLPQAKLDILFRIRTYDNTACFNEKPNVHNFPDASVAENFVIQVCLKSLPRLDRIPGIDAALDAAKMTACLQKQQHVDRIPLPCHEKGKHRCAFRVELEEEEDEYDPSMVEGTVEGDGGDGDDSLQLTSAAISHREKQLLKYRKRMLKREKKKKTGSAGEGSSNGSSSSNTSIGADSVNERNGSSIDSSLYLSAKHYNMSGPMGSIGSSVVSKMSTTAAGASGFGNGVSVITSDECSNGSCRNALTSSINSIQPPLYSSSDHHQAMVICEDRFHPASTNSKSTQTTTTSGLSNDMLPPVVSVATQTDPTVLVTPVCRDCNNRSLEVNGRVTESAPISQNVNHASSNISSSSSSSTNRDRYMQYFNDYYRTYNIINENCDKGPAAAAAPKGCVKPAVRTTTDVPMEEGTFYNVQKPRANGTDANNGLDFSNSTTTRRPCFIVGGDGYEGDEDDDGSSQKRNRETANGSSQQRDTLLQAIQRTAMASGSDVNHREKQANAKHGHGQTALNNNNYTTANNNIVECETSAVNDGYRVPAEVGGGKQLPGQQIDARCNEKDDRESSTLAAKKCESSECDSVSKEKKLDLGDCRLCKRQKTKHNFKLNLSTLLSTSSLATAIKGSTTVVSSCAKKEATKKNMITTSTVLDCGTTPPGCRRTLSESLVGHLTIPSSSGTSSAANGHNSGTRSDGNDAVCSTHGLNEGYPSGEELSPGDSPMLSSSTGAVGNGIFTFEQMKSYRRAFSEDVIDTITSLGPRAYESNDRNQTTEEDSTEDDGSNGGCDNENDHVFAQELGSSLKTCNCAVDRRMANVDDSLKVLGTTVTTTTDKCGHQIPRRHRPHTSTPAAAGNGNDCKEPLYISCSETDCSVSTASSVSPHKKQILSCAAIGNSSQASSLSNSRKEDHCSSLKQQLMQHKPSSKINLNYVFCLSPLARDDSGFTSGSSPATSATFPATSPIAIDGGITSRSSKNARPTNGGGAFSPAGLFRYDFEETPVSPVSGTIKSKSAPVFPFSPPAAGGALSPRFVRNAQRQFHHRTRYPSDRSSFSERSSIGSDEQLSDDDLSSYLLDSSNGGSYCSPLSGPQLLPFEDVCGVGSSSKMGRYTGRSSTACILPSTQMLSKVLNRNLFKFGRAPMLGTLEESLLQRRLTPKFQVADFKVLLGASGSFCPTQLTIPAASYFYELPGQHLTTPYVCELRLPRKGYSIPRTGTVQATLLNPLGTVVRMFVVPYDFRDMPAMSTTFIRQRILACDDSSLKLLGKNIEQLSNAEQMKLLRYAIHLRFQTSRSGKLSLHTDIRLLISRRTDCDTAAAHAKNLLESPNELKVVTIVPESPKFSLRIDKQQ